MTQVIHLLSEHTINQIAAGEVIENPASVVKELIENSIDAKATRIQVEVSGGGLQKICISDDGVGMGPEDALLCLERHATSKISGADELAAIATMGFRGEALASIASISKMNLQTSLGTGVGSQVKVEGGKIGDLLPCARNRGTTIEVLQLFYNVPARRKFQKSPALCLADIVKVMTQLSLAHPTVAFDLYEKDQQKLNLSKGEGEFLQALKKRIDQVLGDSFLEEATPIDISFDCFSVRGFVGSIENTRPTRSLQYCFINQRAVFCPAISYAVKDAFGTRIAEDRFPIYVLHIEIPFQFIDVNVHPQKKEIRLREEKWIKEKIQEKIEEELFKKERASCNINSLSEEPLSFQLFSPHSFFTRPQESEPSTLSSFPVFEKPLQDTSFLFVEKRAVPIGVHRHLLWLDGTSLEGFDLGLPLDGVVIVDLKAASSRLLFESMHKEEKKNSQSLLLPLSFSCTAIEAQLIEHEEKELEKMGFILRLVGKQSFLIEAIPSMLSEKQSLEFLKMLFSEEKVETWTGKKERILASACSKLMAMRTQGYQESEALEVFYSLAKAKTPLFCPLGHRTIVHMGMQELENLFVKRR